MYEPGKLCGWSFVFSYKPKVKPEAHKVGGAAIAKNRIGDNVTLVVRNPTNRVLSDVSVIDAIPETAEIDIKTVPDAGVELRNNRIVWNIGNLTPGEAKTLAYSIKGGGKPMPARVSWDGQYILSE